jgi:hypothetical protein
MLIDQNRVKFTDDSSGFEVVETPIPETIKGEVIKKYYSEYEVDDLLLGHFDDLGLFERKRFIKIDMVYEMFSWYIERVRDNREIDRYIESQRNDPEHPEDKDIYDNFDYIYKKCKSFGQAKINKKSIWFLKIKWWLHI